MPVYFDGVGFITERIPVCLDFGKVIDKCAESNLILTSLIFEHDVERPLSPHFDLHEAEAFTSCHLKRVDLKYKSHVEAGLHYRGFIDQLLALIGASRYAGTPTPAVRGFSTGIQEPVTVIETSPQREISGFKAVGEDCTNCAAFTQ